MPQNLDLFETSFLTARPSSPLFCHSDFLEKIAEYRSQPIGKRASLLLQRLAVDERRQHYKATQGANRGWRRSRLGGGSGSHFYAWWAPKSAAPLREGADFEASPEGSIFLRDIRHHDDHSPLSPQSFHANYLPLSVSDIRREEYNPAPWTPNQARFAGARQLVRILKGHPGSGKTTALLHAADTTGARRVLYLTYSPDLASLAKDYFDRYCSADKQFHVATYSSFLRQFLGFDLPIIPAAESRKRFERDVAMFQRALGPWAEDIPALYDELHAHLAGDALPVATGRFVACLSCRVPDKAYRERRVRFIGPTGASQALETAARLERNDPAALADRYFPEVAIAWKAAAALMKDKSGIRPEFLEFDCIAVDECQDLTPIESFVIAELAARIRESRRPVSVLMAGDEAQTVRPTDFEWGWLNDLLHARAGTPSEYKLTTNLRSPRRIAEIVNRVWDLYSQLEKKDRPSGAGLAEVDDDSNDQVFYCAASPGPDLNALLAELASREGLALVALDQNLTAIPETLRKSILSSSEVKGLDFHSVCVVDAGRHLERITKMSGNYSAAGDIEGLRKRLCIDQMRVALSRPTERLFWLDVNPSERIVRQSLAFLNGERYAGGVPVSHPAAVLTTLQEEQLDLEERIQRCQTDARQYLSIRPDLAWSRAQQAVALLGEEGTPTAVTDQAARRTSLLTLCEVCFCLAFRNAKLSPELGRPDLYDEARRAAAAAKHFGLTEIIGTIRTIPHASAGERLVAIGNLAQTMARRRADIPPWFLLEIAASAQSWVNSLEQAIAVGENAGILIDILPPFYDVLGLPDAASRKAKLEQRSIDLLLKQKNYRRALQVLEKLSERKPALEARCLEALGEHGKAAEIYRAARDLSAALDCYRAIPDFAAALSLIREIGHEHPAIASLEWVARLQEVIAQRPENFTKVMKPTEKKILEGLLEQAFGASRKKAPPVKKAPTAKKAAVKRKGVPPVRRRRPEPF